jgi:KH-domain-like of EngA bacterial GTPase enzymes, C-terminal
VYTSAKTGQRLPKVLEAVAAAGKQHRSASATIPSVVCGPNIVWYPCNGRLQQPPTAFKAVRPGEQRGFGIHRRRVITATLNMVVREAVGWRSPPSLRGDPRKGRIYYATQAATRPPTYVFFVNEAKLFSEDYRCMVPADAPAQQLLAA